MLSIRQKLIAIAMVLVLVLVAFRFFPIVGFIGLFFAIPMIVPIPKQ